LGVGVGLGHRLAGDEVAVHAPYAIDFYEAFEAAQMSAALLLTALLLFWRSGAIVARALMLAAVWLAACTESIERASSFFGHRLEPTSIHHMLAVTALGAVLSTLLARRPVLALVAIAGAVLLWLVSRFVTESEPELAALHLAWLGGLVGLLVRPSWSLATQLGGGGPPGYGMLKPPIERPRESYALHDAVVFAAATALAALVCVFVMDRRDGSADEWAYTYQAAVFAKGRAYAHAPRCQSFLASFYVFEKSGRLFAQYTPGWPLFMTPFVWLGVVWLSGPVSMGLMAVGIARLARSVMRCCGRWDAPPSARVVRAAGTWGAALSMLGTMTLVNGGSRYPHVFAAALYAWMLEAVFMLSSGPRWDPNADAARKEAAVEHADRWGLALGSAAVLGVATRPADGAFLGFGAAVWFLYAVVRRHVGQRGVVSAALGGAVWAALVLGILRLQMGRWFATGYELNAIFHPWAVATFSWPEPEQWKYGVPLATGAYCWWPCSLGLGLAGLALVRGRALGCVAAMALGCLAYTVFLTYLEFGRGWDWGYGPRYTLVFVVPMAVGGAVALAPLTVAARRRFGSGSAVSRGAPLALAIAAIAVGWLRIVPNVWPTVTDHTRHHASLTRAIEDAHLTNVVVLARNGTTGFNPQDLPTNLPIDLYPKQDVIVAIDQEAPEEAAACLREAYPDRTLYRASGIDPVFLMAAPE
jgi:hypothetical protein